MSDMFLLHLVQAVMPGMFLLASSRILVPDMFLLTESLSLMSDMESWETLMTSLSGGSGRFLPDVM